MLLGCADNYYLVVPGENRIDFVTRGVYIGNMKSATEFSELESRKVTHILCLTKYKNKSRQQKPTRFIYCDIEVADDPAYDIAQHFDCICAFMEMAIQAGGVVFVHCMHGVTRAATAVIVFLMRNRNMSFTDAFALLKEARPIIDLNEGFERALREDEKALQNRAVVDSNRIFTDIIEYKMPADIIFEDDDLLIFNNLHPSSSMHFLVISKSKPIIRDVGALTTAHLPLLLRMRDETKRLVQEHNLSDFLIGFHLPSCISVPHLHMHVILKSGQYENTLQDFTSLNFKTLVTVLHDLQIRKALRGYT